MDILIWLLPIALSLGLIWLLAFLWALRNNQYEDLEGAALRILNDDDLPDEDLPATRPQDDRRDREARERKAR
jgi:cbb3-type cytochrome oxidase maturation protein